MRFHGARLALAFPSGCATFPSVPTSASRCSVPRRILLVDDEPLVRDSIRKVLQFDGHTVETAADGEEALALFRKSSFDLVVTDYEMPGIKGDQLAVAIKAILPLQPVLMISAYGEHLRSASCPLTAVDAIIGKPFQIGELRQAIAKLLVKTGNIIVASSGPDAAQTRLRP